MSVKVIKNKVFDGKKTYEVGDVIKGLSENDEGQLILDGIAEYVGKKEDYILPGEAIDEPNDDIDIEITDDGEKDSSENEDISTEIETSKSDLIDPNAFALNPDDYVKASPTKKKK